MNFLKEFKLSEFQFISQIILFAVMAVITADAVPEASKKDKRGIFGFGLGGYASDFGHGGYGGYGGYGGDFGYFGPKRIGVPIPQPYPVPVDRHIPFPVKVTFLIFFFKLNFILTFRTISGPRCCSSSS